MPKKIRTPTDVPAALKTIDLKAVLRRRGVFTKQKLWLMNKEAAKPLAREILNRKKKVKADKPLAQSLTNEQFLAFREKRLHLIHSYDERFKHSLNQYLDIVKEKALQSLHGITKDTFDDNFDESDEELNKLALITFVPILVALAASQGSEASKLVEHQTGKPTTYVPSPKLQKTIEQNVAKFTGSMLDTDRQHLSDLISNAISEGQSIPEISKLVSNDFDEFSKMQAERISRTEILRDSMQANIDAWGQTGLVEAYEWVVADPSDQCADYAGEIVGSGETFYDSTDFADGYPPLHPNCECDLVPVVFGDNGNQLSYKHSLIEQKERIEELESMLDKRTIEAKELMSKRSDDEVYIKSLEKHLGVYGG